jgi:putative ABC transport system permease protein
MLSLISGQFPVGAGQVAVTSGVASDFHLTIGSSWTVGGVSRKVTGIAANPQNLVDEFALVAPGQVTAPTQVTVLFDAPGVDPATIGPAVAAPQTAASDNIVNPETISLAAAVLGMLLIAMVGAGGFTVLAQRRLRSIGMLAAQGDLARYRARSGPALAAISLSVLIAAIASVISAARFGEAVDYVGPNLTSNQLIVYPPGHDNPNGPPPTASQLAATRMAAQRIAASLDDRYLITLETPSGSLQ